MAIERHRVVWPWRPHLILLLSGIALAGLALLFPHSHAANRATATYGEVGSAIGFVGLLIVAAAAIGARGRLLTRLLGSHEIQVGHDGLLLSELDHRRFIPYGRIVRVATRNAAVILCLEGGEEVALHLWTGSDDDLERRRALVASIENGRTAHAETRSEADTETDQRLERRGRDVRAWVAEARDLGGGGSGYRSAGIEREALWRVVESGNTPEESRIGAALALGTTEDPTERKRLASVAAECVSPRVRVAVEAADDDDALVAQLEAAYARRSRR